MAYDRPSVLMITGGTGSLGNAIVEQLIDNNMNTYKNYEKIIIYSRDERKQEDMNNKFKSYPGYNKLRFFIGDIRDKERLSLACKNVTHVVHAAAMKIVPSIEYNPQECLKTNVIGAQNLIDVIANGSTIEHVLAISTDKAVHPINLYGVSKLAAEKLFLDASNLAPLCKFSVARYGNVTNSRGSVIPFFKECLRQNKPLPITDLNMTRFWITLEEAAEFVIDRVHDMNGDEIFIPDMLSYKIEDLAYALLDDRYGGNPSVTTYGMLIVGMRPGEKLHEDLVSHYEFECMWEHKGFTVVSKFKNPDVTKTLAETSLLVHNSCNSRMYLMEKDELVKKLVQTGIIEAPFPERITANASL